LLALRRPHCADRVKLRKNTVPTPGMPTLPVVSLVPLPAAGIVSTGPSTKRRRKANDDPQRHLWRMAMARSACDS
jgi:hypothetical protein